MSELKDDEADLMFSCQSYEIGIEAPYLNEVILTEKSNRHKEAEELNNDQL